MLKPAIVGKALVLGDAMAMIEVNKEVRSYTLNDIYVPPEKMIKMIHPTSKISQQWLSRLKTMKTNKHFSLKVLRDLTENKNLLYLKEVLDNADDPVTEEQMEMRKFLLFFYDLNTDDYMLFIDTVYDHRDEIVSKYRATVDTVHQTS